MTVAGRSFDPAFVEREYNNRRLVPDHPKYFERWQADSEFVRATLECELDLPYGPDARHRIDLFPARKARGTLVFIHGGYWRSLDKGMFSWLAAAWAADGVSVAMPNYRLCPGVRIEQIVDDMVMAMSWLSANGTRHGMAMDHVVVSGHSAGGHLAAALLAQPGAAFDGSRIRGAVPISGIFDFAPLEHFSFNADLRLDAGSIERLGLLDKRPTVDAPLVIAAGGDESSEFQRQSRDLAAAWQEQTRALLILPGLNHFSIVDALAERGQPLFSATLALFP